MILLEALFLGLAPTLLLSMAVLAILLWRAPELAAS
jgi:hypothetical protein